LVLFFESICDNCELGLVQRRVGAEALGLLRFARAPLRHLIRALNARFAQISYPEHINIDAENGEYMVKLTKFDLTYHAHVKVGDIEPEALRQQREDVPDLDLPSWMQVLRHTHAIFRHCRDGRLVHVPAMKPARTELTFGVEGNASVHLGSGWSEPEVGYQWTVGKRSVATLAVPGEAEQYWLEMEVKPYLKPPLLPRQRLDVVAGGQLVHSIPNLAVGEVGCVVPGGLVAGKSKIEIVFNHPDAASPMLIAGQPDDRRLGISFRRLALLCT
jgi:hypothetical protein